MRLYIPIECGEWRCAEDPSKFCRFVSTIHSGQVGYCYCSAFMKELEDSRGDGTGWLVRCEECVETAVAEPRSGAE